MFVFFTNLGFIYKSPQKMAQMFFFKYFKPLGISKITVIRICKRALNCEDLGWGGSWLPERTWPGLGWLTIKLSLTLLGPPQETPGPLKKICPPPSQEDLGPLKKP
jgi:hypothetical protein